MSVILASRRHPAQWHMSVILASLWHMRTACATKGGCLGGEQGGDVHVGNAVAALEEGQLEDDRDAGDEAAGVLDELTGGGDGAARRQHVVHDRHALALADGVLGQL